jgi:Uma2 family endonuclease
MNVLASELKPYAPYRFTYEEVMRMAEAGVFERLDGWRVELIDGELIAVPPQSPAHVRWKTWLFRRLYAALPENHWSVVTEAALQSGRLSGPEPDAFVYPASVDDRRMAGSDVVWAAEVSYSSLSFDLGRKAQLYAEAGVAEYWVLDIVNRQVVVHCDRSGSEYCSVTRVETPEVVSPLALPELRLRLAELPASD